MLVAALKKWDIQRPGVRIGDAGLLRHFLTSRGVVGQIAAALAGDGVRPVRAVLFDKNPAANWSLGWHQDRVICVRQRIDVPEFGPWTVKDGLPHVAPPPSLMARMVTLRVHLDPAGPENAPLLIAPGSHLGGRVSIDRIAEVVTRTGVHACLAAAGDVWAYATPILHASEAAVDPGRRRVLQVDYSPDDLPGGLEWMGV
jgi:hypothetical protein